MTDFFWVNYPLNVWHLMSKKRLFSSFVFFFKIWRTRIKPQLFITVLKLSLHRLVPSFQKSLPCPVQCLLTSVFFTVFLILYKKASVSPPSIILLSHSLFLSLMWMKGRSVVSIFRAGWFIYLLPLLTCPC